MQSVLKKAVIASVPAALVVGISSAHGDEVQSIAAQAIAHVASQPPAPPLPPVKPILELPGNTFIVNGIRP